jgi:hypothetical protein
MVATNDWWVWQISMWQMPLQTLLIDLIRPNSILLEQSKQA